MNLLYIQNGDEPIVEVPTNLIDKSFWEGLKGLSFDEFIATLANGLISFAFKLGIAIIVLYIGRFIIRKLYKTVFHIMTSRHVDASLTTFVLSLVKIILYFILIITIVGILGIETSSFLALFASAGVAIGMALSGTLQNFAGGVLILLLKPYKVGDYIEVQGFSGTVKSIQLFSTIINTIDNKAIILPNGVLSTSSINNYSLEKYRRVDWDISLSYGTDIADAKEKIMSMLISDHRVAKQYTEELEDADVLPAYNRDMDIAIPTKVERKPFVALKQMGDSSIVITARAWTTTVNYWQLFFDMNERFYTELPKMGFSFPFPQIDVHLDHPEMMPAPVRMQIKSKE